MINKEIYKAIVYVETNDSARNQFILGTILYHIVKDTFKKEPTEDELNKLYCLVSKMYDDIDLEPLFFVEHCAILNSFVQMLYTDLQKEFKSYIAGKEIPGPIEKLMKKHYES